MDQASGDMFLLPDSSEQLVMKTAGFLLLCHSAGSDCGFLFGFMPFFPSASGKHVQTFSLLYAASVGCPSSHRFFVSVWLLLLSFFFATRSELLNPMNSIFSRMDGFRCLKE